MDFWTRAELLRIGYEAKLVPFSLLEKFLKLSYNAKFQNFLHLPLLKGDEIPPIPYFNTFP